MKIKSKEANFGVKVHKIISSYEYTSNSVVANLIIVCEEIVKVKSISTIV